MHTIEEFLTKYPDVRLECCTNVPTAEFKYTVSAWINETVVHTQANRIGKAIIEALDALEDELHFRRERERDSIYDWQQELALDREHHAWAAALDEEDQAYRAEHE